ncbi:RND family efflux transporter MFP subunit [Natronocella acetinitrilica]|uniref:RND family efflux transporter MFP subunit n=1 Tax=Natronocella acetinitrilica TaxID=414046 RepID=A0AAE3G9C2_9GAMM|nr:efflux RND transporter periplasmic adaptor subunit [Natronocella acetinitrilica]MCP1676858.1 RND family efflux transporter MFP subunit [Natronocella acetinitrilica]
MKTAHSRTGLFFLFAAFALIACGGNGDNDQADNDDDSDGVLITTVTVEKETVEVLERTIGRISSRTTPSLTSEVTGRILSVHVDAGDRVSRGDLLLEIDPEPYELSLASASTDIRRLEALLRNQERELARNRELLEDGFVTQAMVDGAEAEQESLEEQLEAAQVARRNAERDLRNTEVRSPVAGEIDERHVSDGDYTSPGEPLFRLISQDLLRVRLPFPESAAPRLEIGQAVRLRAALTDNSDVEGQIAELRPGLTDGSRAIEAIINVRNPGGWRQGGTVNADVVVLTRESVVVPNQSVVQRPRGEVVYVIEDDTAHARDVRVGRRLGSSTEILEGLDDGDRVAVDGAGFLSDGASVRVSED